MEKNEVVYSTGDVSKELNVSKTTVINLVKDFNLEVRKNPKNGYRYFTIEDLHKIREIQGRISEVGKDQALQEWNNPQGPPNSTAIEKSVLEVEALKRGLALRTQHDEVLVQEIHELKKMVHHLRASQISRGQFEDILVKELPMALKDVLREKDEQIASLKQQLNRIERTQNNRDKALVEALRQSQETQKQLAAGLIKEKLKKWWKFW